MVFGKKTIRCENCNSKINEKYSFCPNCGDSVIDEEMDARDYGLLGKNPYNNEIPETNPLQANFGITDKLISSVMNSLMKNLEKQFNNFERESEKTEVQAFPNGIKIRIGQVPTKKKKTEDNFFKREISKQQMKKMTSLPRTEAKTKVKRIGEKVIYELLTPGIESPQDVFVSKLESGYEIKAIGEKKIYVNTIPITIPIRKFAIDNDKLFLEFQNQNQF